MWQAVFNTGIVLESITQVEGHTVERSFSAVMNSLETLESLSVIQGARKVTVRMSDGRFTTSISGVDYDFYATDYATTFQKKLENIRPIYFIRETVEFKTTAQQHMGVGSPAALVFTALGFQANVDGVNIKRYLAILPDGMYTIEGT